MVGVLQPSDMVYKPGVELFTVAVPAALKLTVMLLQVKAGSIVSSTVKVVEQVLKLPLTSVPVNVIGIGETGANCAEVKKLGAPVNVKPEKPQASVLPPLKIEAAIVALQLAFK
jgi:hypothetical protein